MVKFLSVVATESAEFTVTTFFVTAFVVVSFAVLILGLVIGLASGTAGLETGAIDC